MIQCEQNPEAPSLEEVIFQKFKNNHSQKLDVQDYGDYYQDYYDDQDYIAASHDEVNDSAPEVVAANQKETINAETEVEVTAANDEAETSNPAAQETEPAVPDVKTSEPLFEEISTLRPLRKVLKKKLVPGLYL